MQVCKIILTQLEEIWKMTSIFVKRRQFLFENGRQPKKKCNQKQLKVKTILF
jgi:hypothetical protein